MSRKHVWLSVQVAVTTLLGFLLWRRVDWSSFFELFGRLSAAFYFGSLATLAVGQLLYALRWRVILGSLGARVSYRDVIRQHFIGLCFGNVLPTGVGGDATKIFLLGRTVGYLEVTASVFVDRFLGFFWLAIGGAALVWVAAPGVDAAVHTLNRNLLTSFAAAFIGLIVAAQTLPVEQWLGRIPARWNSRAAKTIDVVVMVRRALRPLSMSVSAVVTLGYSSAVAEIYRVYFAIAGLPIVPLSSLILVVVSVAIFVNVPLSINGIGLREQLHVLLLGALGIPAEAAVWISLLLFAHMLVLSMFGLMLWLGVRTPIEGTPA